jgi:cytoskeleton protein RodZ
MPLDTGAMIDGVFASANLDLGRQPLRPLGIREGEHIGQVLRSNREHLGMSLEDVSETTAVKPAYLRAIEAMQFDQLPSRPFTIGFIRAYAEAVRVEPDLAVGRFKSDNPERSQPLRAPFGVDKTRDGRARLVIAIGIVVFASILAWNVVQRALSSASPPPPVVADSPANRKVAPAISSQNPVSLGAPSAPPPEATTPEPYETPGLDRIMAGSDAAPAAVAPGAAPVKPGAVAPGAMPNDALITFKPQGRVYGAPANASLVTLQARKSGTVVLHSGGGGVVLAQVLQKGEAFRLPNNPALTLDVSDPAGFNVYVGGQLHNALAATLTPLAKIGAPSAPNADKPSSRR